jgi:hypothetical protein
MSEGFRVKRPLLECCRCPRVVGLSVLCSSAVDVRGLSGQACSPRVLWMSGVVGSSVLFSSAVDRMSGGREPKNIKMVLLLFH